MKAPKDVDSDMVVVLEIVQHCGEILSRLPLYVLRGHLDADQADNAWLSRARAAVMAAESFELACAQLSAEEARVEPPAPARPAVVTYPDDALPSA